MLNQLLAHALEQNNMTADEAAQRKIVAYLTLLQTWNQVFNLTRITIPTEMVYLHIIDSLVIQPHLSGKRLLDVGSGAGLPGIPLAILNPEQQWVLLDKNSKKARFLTQAIADLALHNVKVVHGACENFHPSYCFDHIVSRALTTIGQFVSMTAHLLCPHGNFLAMKGKYPQDELNDIPSGFMVQEMTKLDIKGIDVVRHVICLSRKPENEEE